MQKKKARKGFLFLRRESVLPPCRAGPVCPAGTNTVFCGGTHGSRPTRCGGHTGRTESSAPTHLVIASQSAPRSKCPWGTDWRGNPFPSARPPLDKPAGMGIIINRRGRCDKRSAPLRENFNEPYGSQKPSPCRVAVFVFQLHNTNRNGIPPDVESKYPVHVCHPLSGL